MKNKKLVVGLVAALAVLVVVFGAVMLMTKPETESGSKLVMIEVIEDDAVVAIFKEKSDFEYLGELLLDRGIAEGDVGDYGLFITSVNGREADAANQEWWCLTKDGEEVFTGADSTPIADGDKFELTLTVGW